MKYKIIFLMLLSILIACQAYAAGTNSSHISAASIYEIPGGILVRQIGSEPIANQYRNDSSSDYLGYGLEYSHHPDMVWNGLAITRRSDPQDDKEAYKNTYLLSGKIIPDLSSQTVTPFLSGGVGVIRSVTAVRGFDGFLRPTGNLAETEICVKAGAGMNILLRRSLSLDLQADYFRGVKDIRTPDSVRMILGLSCRF